MATERQAPPAIDPPIYLPATGSWPKSWYLLDQRAKDAIDLAVACGRPLLVRGQPGTGKSDLARAAAEYLGRAFVYEVITARTEPQELLWRFDTIARLADAQAKSAGGGGKADPGEPLHYVSPGVLWWALNWGGAEDFLERHCKTASQRPDEILVFPKGEASQSERASAEGCVLLLDEIDKADSDLPNSLLEVLANTGFRLPWGNIEIQPAEGQANTRPLIVITTNEDRELPPAFVRRCLALRIDTGSNFEDWIKQRAWAHFRASARDKDPRPFLHNDVVEKAVQYLMEERQGLPADGPRPGLAEFLDLLRGLTALAPDDRQSQLDWLERVYEFAYRKQPA